jgi:hypothetical protein
VGSAGSPKPIRITLFHLVVDRHDPRARPIHMGTVVRTAPLLGSLHRRGVDRQKRMSPLTNTTDVMAPARGPPRLGTSMEGIPAAAILPPLGFCPAVAG